ncbi:MAG: T9SS type A sorting domain-containing protein [Chitinophagaceae bacterium]|nr:MAG: T9SS type A sorting domain-containing protein [Chitinophagaceae bacterium]
MTTSSLSGTGIAAVATTAPRNSNPKGRIRRLFFVLAAALSAGLAGAQTTQTVFSENMGTPSGTTAIAANTFQNTGLTFSGTGDVRITSASSGYTGASGGGNVFIAQTIGVNFVISNINTSSFTSIGLTFGLNKSGGAGTPADLVVEYSTDGTNYSPLTYTTSGGAVWSLKTAVGTIPSSSTLSLRFRQAAATQNYRVDDVKLTGIPNTPTTTSISPTSVNAGGSAFTITVNGTNFIKGTANSTNLPTGTASSVVTYGGTPATTTFLSSTQLSATIPSGAINAGGTVNIGVSTNGAAAASNTQPLTVTTQPSATTGTASLTNGSGTVTLNGTVNAATASTTVSFDFGLTNTYGSNVAASPSPVTGSTNTAVTANLTGILDPNVTYHFRVVASNSGGSAEGSDVTFVSPAATPSAPTVNNATVTSMDVTLNSDANPGSTEYAILETTSNQYVQANGALGASPAWATMGTWGTKTVTGLAGNTQYTFVVIARNSTGTTTASSSSASATTVNGNSISINGASFAASYCNASSHIFDVSFTAGGTFNGTFKVQISDASGVFPSNTTDNIIGTGAGSPISVTIPSGYAAGTGYRFRVLNDNPEFYGTDNGNDVAIVAAVTPSVSIATNPGTTICSGTSVTFTATPTNGGTPTYAWTKNGSPVGTNSNTYTDAALADGDVIMVTMTSSITCVTANGVSDQATMTVNTTPAPPAPTVTNGCGNASLTAIADPGAPLAYYWQGTTNGGTATDAPATSNYTVTVAGTYYVRAFNSSTGCWSTTSPSAVVSAANIIAAPAITVQPSSLAVYLSGPATFMAASSGAVTNGRVWQVSDDGGNSWNNVTAGGGISTTYGTTSYLAINSVSAGMLANQYRLQVTGNSPCGNIESSVVSFSSTSPAQAVIFNETVGTTAGGGTAVASYNGYSNGIGLAFSSTTTNKTDARTSQSSLGYANVSGSSGFFMGTAGAFQRDLIISNINTSNYNNIVLMFGVYRSNLSATFTIDVSTDGTNWTPLTFSYPASTSTWTPIIASGTIPSTSNLRIRFTKDGNGDIRLDDIRLAGYFSDPTTTSISPSSAFVGDATFTLTVNGTNFQSGASVVTWNGLALTTTYVSSIKLTATVPASLLTSAGTRQVAVTTAGAQNQSNNQTFTIEPRSITLNSISGNSFCNGSANALTVGFTPVGTFNGSYFVQLSDASGNFPNNTTDNIISSGSNGSPIVASIPQGTPAGTYRVRVLNTNPELFSNASGNITIDQSGSATLSYPGSPYCTSTGTGTVFFSGTNGGTFSATPAGLVIDANSGAIDIAASASGTYTVTYSFAGGTACASTASTQVSIRPATLLEPVGNQVYCTGVATTPINFSGAAGVTYSWANTNSSIGLASSGTGNIPSFTAANAGNSVAYATISVLPQGGTGCTAKIMSFRIAVNPMPTVNTPANQVLCAGASTSPVNFTGALAGTTYSWTSNNTAIGYSASGTGNIPSFVTQNNTGVLQTATFTVTPYAGSCAGNPATFTIAVSPAAGTINYAGSPYCQVGPATVTHRGSAGGTYTSTAGLSLNAATGSVNLGASTPGTYTVTYTVAASGGCSATATAQITINPQATVNNIPNQEYCDGVATAPIAFSGTATSYNWSNDNTAIGLAASGSGTSLPSFTTVNAGPGSQYAYVTVVPQGNGSNICTASKGVKFRIRVNFCPPITQPGDTNGGDATARTSSSITLSPNPASGQVTVQYKGTESGPFSLQVLNSQGAPATRAQSFSGTTATVDLSTLRPGVYMLQLVNTRSGATVQKQLIKL